MLSRCLEQQASGYRQFYRLTYLDRDTQIIQFDSFLDEQKMNWSDIWHPLFINICQWVLKLFVRETLKINENIVWNKFLNMIVSCMTDDSTIKPNKPALCLSYGVYCAIPDAPE